MLSQLVFSVTHDCPISCNYCVTRSGPFGGSYLDGDFMCSVINEMVALGNLRLVVFTGGEPLLKKADVKQAIRHAASLGIWTRIVTNAFWAKTPTMAYETLAELKEAGLSEVNFSCDDFHQEHIPIDNIRHAREAVLRLQVPMLLAHKKVKDARITDTTLSELLGVPLQRFDPSVENPRFDVYDSGYTVPVGHRSETLPEDQYIVYPDYDGAWKVPCSSVLSCTIIGPERDIRLCCGMIEQDVPELSFGKVGEQSLLELICRANTDLIANWLALEGPYGILRFVQDKAPHIVFREQYVNCCHLCNDLLTRAEVREVLQDTAAEKASELTLRRGILEAVRTT